MESIIDSTKSRKIFARHLGYVLIEYYNQLTKRGCIHAHTHRSWGECSAELKRLNIDLPSALQDRLETEAGNSPGNVECVFK